MPRSKKMRERFAYGQAADRMGVHVPAERGMTMRPGPVLPTWLEKYLRALMYTINNSVIGQFQSDWNAVVSVGMIKGPLLKVSNMIDKMTEKSIQAAYNFQKTHPKPWIHYVKKARVLGG